MALEVGSIVEGVITGITDFGAFVELPGGEVGLVHISEVASTYVQDITHHLVRGDKAKVKVLGLNPKGKYDLSIRQAAAPGDEEKGFGRPKKIGKKFEDMMSTFLKESSEHQLSLKRSKDAKRGRRGC